MTAHNTSYFRTTAFRPEHYAWIFLYLNLLMLFPRTGASVTSVDPQTGFRILMVLIAGGIAALSLFGNSRAIRSLFSLPILAFFAFALIALFSSSYASVPLYSMWKGLEIVVDTLAIAIIIGSTQQPGAVHKTYNLTVLLIALTAASAWIGAVINPGFAFTPEKGLLPFRLQGYYPLLNSNSLGTFSAITALVAAIRILNGTDKKAFFAIVFVAMFITMILSTSRTALFSFLIGLVVFSYFSKRKALLGTLLGLIALVAIGGALQEFAVEWFRKGQADSTLQSLSGRTKGWSAAWELFLQSPMGGHGIASAGRFDVLEGGRASTLHGSFFDVIVGVGVVGVTPWLVGIFFTGYRLLRPRQRLDETLLSDDRRVRAEVLAVFAFLLVRGFTSSGLALHEKEFMLLLTLAAIATAGFGRRSSPADETELVSDEPRHAHVRDNILRRRRQDRSAE